MIFILYKKSLSLLFYRKYKKYSVYEGANWYGQKEKITLLNY